MKNYILGVIVVVVLIVGGFFLLNQNKQSDSIAINDEFGRSYDIAEHIYKPIDPDTFIEKMDNDDTFILFIGRPTCPYCKQTVPALNEAATNFGYNEIHYMDSELEENYAFLDANNIDSVPFTAFIKDGVSLMVVPGYVEASVFEEILMEIS